MTAFLQCFWIVSQIGVASNRNLTSSFGKAYDPFCTEKPWANLRYFQKFLNLEPGFQIVQISDPIKCVLGPGDVFACFRCPIFYRIVYHIENVPQTVCDAPQKLILHTFPSIWHWPFFINIFKNIEISSKRGIGKIGFCLYCIACWYCLLAPVIPLWKNSSCDSLVEEHC